MSFQIYPRSFLNKKKKNKNQKKEIENDKTPEVLDLKEKSKFEKKNVKNTLWRQKWHFP